MILELGNNLLKCKILTGDKLVHKVFINGITHYYDNANAFTLKLREFFLKVAFEMTINKSQGQTFEKSEETFEKMFLIMDHLMLQYLGLNFVNLRKFI